MPWLVAALVLVLATVVVTGSVHLPLNRALLEVDAATRAAAAAGRRAFETRWVRWNVVRTVTSTASFAALAGGPPRRRLTGRPDIRTTPTTRRSPTMNITVFGATGTIGRLVVDQALAAGHDVTAVTRDATRLTQRHDRLSVVEADPTDPAACVPAVKDADAVVVALGAGRRGEVREAGTRAVVEAMQEAGVRRLVCQSTMGVGSSEEHLTFWWRYVMFGALLRQAFADHVAQEAVVEAQRARLDHRPALRVHRRAGRIAGPGAARVRRLRQRACGSRSGGADVAAFVLAQAEDATFVHQAVSLSA